MRRINLGDIVRSGNDTGEVCFVSTHYFCMCVRMGAIALYDVKVVVSRTLNDFEIIRKVDSDSLESVTSWVAYGCSFVYIKNVNQFPYKNVF